MTRSSSAIAAGTSCMGRVAKPENRSGQDSVIWLISSLHSREVAMVTSVSMS